jgi:hypothetical protein
MSDHENCSPANKRVPSNKGKLVGARAPLATQARLGDQDPIAVGGANTRPRHV